jgi:hypothetical protein
MTTYPDFGTPCAHRQYIYSIFPILSRLCYDKLLPAFTCPFLALCFYMAQADVKAMPFDDRSFASILDKGTLDALM